MKRVTHSNNPTEKYLIVAVPQKALQYIFFNIFQLIVLVYWSTPLLYLMNPTRFISLKTWWSCVSVLSLNGLPISVQTVSYWRFKAEEIRSVFYLTIIILYISTVEVILLSDSIVFIKHKLNIWFTNVSCLLILSKKEKKKIDPSSIKLSINKRQNPYLQNIPSQGPVIWCFSSLNSCAKQF